MIINLQIYTQKVLNREARTHLVFLYIFFDLVKGHHENQILLNNKTKHWSYQLLCRNMNKFHAWPYQLQPPVQCMHDNYNCTTFRPAKTTPRLSNNLKTINLTVRHSQIMCGIYSANRWLRLGQISTVVKCCRSPWYLYHHILHFQWCNSSFVNSSASPVTDNPCKLAACVYPQFVVKIFYVMQVLYGPRNLSA